MLFVGRDVISTCSNADMSAYGNVLVTLCGIPCKRACQSTTNCRCMGGTTRHPDMRGHKGSGFVRPRHKPRFSHDVLNLLAQVLNQVELNQ